MYNFLVKCRAFQFSQCCRKVLVIGEKLYSSFSRLTFYSFISRKKLFFDGNEEIRLRSIYQPIYI